MDKNLRIRTNISADKVVNVNVTQDVKTLEILSLNLTQENYYKLHESNYGVIVGRVLANDAFGIPNVKVSVFIKLTDEDATDTEITNLYPYTSVQSFDKENRKYNLLPDELDDECYRVVGTFPNKRLVLDNDSVLEVYDKYWKYTTVTNNAGDYMLFGVPTGNQDIHVDVDLSDIGVLSQKPRDMMYKGYNLEQFDSPTQFKEGTNLNNLSQIISQNQSVYVYPFWGDEDLGEIAISRCDINMDYKFEPTCVFMGSLVTDNGNEQISHKCTPSKYVGFNRDLITGEGTIEMIRKTIDGKTEYFQIKGNQLINENGVWCYQIPMNLDYVQTDEYGNVIPTDNPNKGIPTRARVRFRISFGEEDVDGSSKHRAKYLVPNNPELANDIEPQIESAGTFYEKYYEFGSATMDNCYRNLYWNKVYSVKSFIPRIQTTAKKGTTQYTGIRTTNSSQSLNPFPFNKARFKLFFVFRVICIILTIIIDIIWFINKIISGVDWIANKKIPVIGIRPFKSLCLDCMEFNGGLAEESDNGDVRYFPGCSKNGIECSGLKGQNINTDRGDLANVIQQNLAQEFDTVNFDFYNDWINGCLYFPMWYWKKTKKKKYLFGLFSKKAQNTFCKCDVSQVYSKLRNGYLCAIDKSFPNNNNEGWQKAYKNNDGDNDDDKDWATKYRDYRKLRYGVIKEKTNADQLNVYYYSFGNMTDSKYVNDLTGTYTYNRLFSTDLILLGSFNDCDLDGIPKLFRYLPSSTANIPFISKVTEAVEDDDDDDTEEGTTDDTGTIVLTGMDWLSSDGTKNMDETGNVQYGAGLLFDLSCTGISTKPKTNINLERMSELGVALDMSYEIPYTDGNTSGNLMKANTIPDGMITRYEINDNNSRHMFASLNHLGLDNLVRNSQTTYDIYKLGQTYPMDFDGMLNVSKKYTKNADEKTYDNLDINYVEFRLGEYPHAYLREGNNTYYPLYNNSFYFYFGLNEGNSAIDKFKSQYDADCYQSETYPFNVTYTTQNGTWCQHPESTESDHSTDFAAIDVDLSDIVMPYSFEFTNSDGVLLFSGETISDESLHFGYSAYTDSTINTRNGQRAVIGNTVYSILDDDEYLTNSTYYLKITDNKKESITTVIEIIPQRIEATISKTSLGKKYYGYSTTKIEDIADTDESYGTIEISEFYVDGNNYHISDKPIPTIVSSGGTSIVGYDILLTQDASAKTGHKQERVFLYFKVTPLVYDTTVDKTAQDIEDISTSPYCGKDFITIPTSGNGKFNLFLDSNDNEWNDHPNQAKRHNCGCQNTNTVPTYEWDKDNDKLIFNVWIPTKYTCIITEYIDYTGGTTSDKLSDNILNQAVTIENGKTFVATLDSMPLQFINTDNFYKSSMTNKTPVDLKGWYGLNNLDMRKLQGSDNAVYYIPNYKNKDDLTTYQDYMTTSFEMDSDNHITNSGVLTIEEFLFNAMLTLSQATYSLDESTASHQFKLSGGKEPRIIRCLYPRYEDLDSPVASLNLYDSDTIAESHYLTDKWTIDCNGTSSVNTSFPDIISSPYKYQTGKCIQYPQFTATSASCVTNGVQFNQHVDTNSGKNNFYLSTYFAGFTKNGGFVETGKNTYTHDDTIKPERIPANANVLTDISPKVLSKDIRLSDYSNLVLKTNAYFPAPYIDRRFDYDLYVFTIGDYDSYVSLPLTQYTYVHGGTYNGLEMTYEDDTYELIDYPYMEEEGEEEVIKVVSGLEYSFAEVERSGVKDPDENNKTYVDRLYYLNTGNSVNHRFYSAQCNGLDMLQQFQSSFRSVADIENGTNSTTYTDLSSQTKNLYFLKGTIGNFDTLFHNSSTSNGRFDANNFCTKRTLNFVVPTRTTFALEVISCSYNTTASLEDDGFTHDDNDYLYTTQHLSCTTSEGEDSTIELEDKKIVTINGIDAFDSMFEKSDFNVLYITPTSSTSSTATVRGIRISCRCNADTVCSTHSTLTTLQTLILSDSTNVYDYIARVGSTKGSVEYATFQNSDTSEEALYQFKTYGDTVRLPMNDASNFSTKVLMSTVTEDTFIYDAESYAQDVKQIVKNGGNFTMIDPQPNGLGYNTSELYQPTMTAPKYLGIGGIRRYINTTDDNLEKSVHLINFSKICNIAPFKVTYNKVTADTNAYIITVVITVNDDIDADKFASSAKARLKDLSKNFQSVTSASVTFSVNGKNITFTIKYAKDATNLSTTYSSWWQELYVKAQNGLVYCVTYIKPTYNESTATWNGPLK